jgi:hypothetical protein
VAVVVHLLLDKMPTNEELILVATEAMESLPLLLELLSLVAEVAVLVVNHQQSLAVQAVGVMVVVEHRGNLGLLEQQIQVVVVVDKHGLQQITQQPLVAQEL